MKEEKNWPIHNFLNALDSVDILEFDYQASTPCSSEVLESMYPYWTQNWANPSNKNNRSGLKVSAAVSIAREKIAEALEISPQRIVFTSGATEANNLVLLGHARYKARKMGRPGHLITLLTEHHAVLDPIRQLREEGFRVTEIRPSQDGLIPLEEFRNSFEDDTFLVSLMFANNEIGVLQPMKEIAKICKNNGAIIHSDCAQAFGYIPLYPEEIGLDSISISAHKIYGPKGIGALIISNELAIDPLFWGGGQENGLRPGTLPAPLIVGFGTAVELAVKELDESHQKLKFLRNTLWEGLEKNIPNLILNGCLNPRLPHNINFTVEGVKGSELHRNLRSFIACSSGSACAMGAPSHVLLALGKSVKEAEASIRMSIGKTTSMEEIEKAILILTQIINELRRK